MTNSRFSPYNFMLLTHRHENKHEYLQFIKEALNFGVNCIQFREKEITKDSLTFAWQLKELLKEAHVPLIINDNLGLAMQLDADGLHLGQDDMSVKEARNFLGNNKIIGLSLEHESQIQKANELPVDYVACSAVFATKSKTNIKTIWGLTGLERVCKESKHPVIAIGGIHEDNVSDVIKAGAYGVAVISALHDSPHLEKTINKISAAIALVRGKK